MSRKDNNTMMPRSAAASAWTAAALAALVLLPGCASGPNANPRDPLEPLNRSVSKFNDNLDSVLLKPVATAYKEITPAPVRTGVSNFFGNLGDAWSFVNSLLQLKGQDAAENFMRFSFNTVFGFAGVLDIASEMNIERHKEDFGQTLGRWGVPAGPYLVLPALGPSTLRDTAALSVDTYKGDLVMHVSHIPTRNSLYALRAVEKRSNLLRASSVLDEAALDKYSFTRDVFLQLRRSEIYDGKEPSGGNDATDGKEPPMDGKEAPAR